MKKIFTVLFAIGSFTFANAQYHGDTYSRNNSHDDAGKYDDRRPGSSYSFSARERDEQIARVNSLYDAKIRDISFERFLRPNKKRKEIEKLNFQRAQEIRNISVRFSDHRNHFSDTYAAGNYDRRH